jgi:hypothetical protein
MLSDLLFMLINFYLLIQLTTIVIQLIRAYALVLIVKITIHFKSDISK